MDKILKSILKREKPTPADRERLGRVATELINRTNAACSKLGVEAKAMLVGSAARNTWLRSERDIDIFILLPEGLSREELERQGLAVAREVAGKRGKESFAEHPYVTMRFKGFDVDLVPCYDITKLNEIRSAVDRSPHHQRYVKKQLTPGLTDEVLLLKQFMSGTGIYGAELRVQGFSGYLCELLVLHYGSFEKLVKAASRWRPSVVIDPERSYADEAEPRALFEGQPLIVIDPVDASRNVGAAVSIQSFATFVRACQDFAQEPGKLFFFPRPVQRLSVREIQATLERRGTTLFCVTFSPPDVVPDVLYPQLRKAERALVTRLARAGFEVMRSDVWSNSQALILLELAVKKLPRVRTRFGPPISIEVGDFIHTHLKSKRKFAGPFVDTEGRLVFEIEREQAKAKKVLEQALGERTTLGKHVGEAIARGYQIYEGKNIVRLCEDGKVRKFISEYLTHCLPWYR
ncbi:MAG: CCA tRNA nucleotidyltransferase [Hadesarchaea archaeon]|nr:MAG: CCA tRNA nucleotidyltransferase [Hadesarchaea archaeon]